ncbi:uncharacterized protein B0I36DRAFT_325058 [Microdochium trichocladiopsis]|uniref:Uncharacterized protein n=1 Tax=Microdochium trichocladiopsis TaxID=1682393 RepID=A0A9P8Y651_9PEZI|nr:uncharacterized protein B0I36DRAFT_325058 [Microdochium trichocladiopsis]KAH7029113.1 hypothetical protein B0I36DRAFT_325058 [Microdochium trichocladiopsis]
MRLTSSLRGASLLAAFGCSVAGQVERARLVLPGEKGNPNITSCGRVRISYPPMQLRKPARITGFQKTRDSANQ